MPELIAMVRELESQKQDLIHWILSDEGHSMIDCRICFFSSYCGQTKDGKPDYDVCEQGIRKMVESEE